MHAVDRAPNAASAAASASAAAAAAAAVDDGEDFSASKGWSDGSGGHTAATVRALWGDTARMPPHPFLVQMIPRSGSGSDAASSSAAGAAGVAGECADRVWTLYSYPHHSSLAVHVASLLVEQRDSLLLAQSFAAEDELPQPVPPPAMLLPAEVLRFLSAELLLLLSFLHGRGLVARGLALAQVYLSSQGHLQLLDPFLCETVEAAAARRRDDAYTSECPPAKQWHATHARKMQHGRALRVCRCGRAAAQGRWGAAPPRCGGTARHGTPQHGAIRGAPRIHPCSHVDAAPFLCPFFLFFFSQRPSGTARAARTTAPTTGAWDWPCTSS